MIYIYSNTSKKGKTTRPGLGVSVGVLPALGLGLFSLEGSRRFTCCFRGGVERTEGEVKREVKRKTSAVKFGSFASDIEVRTVSLSFSVGRSC